MMLEPECSKRKCVHFLGVKDAENEEDQVPTCEAYPQGIPNDIAFGENKHLEPNEGDHGIMYEKA